MSCFFTLAEISLSFLSHSLPLQGRRTDLPDWWTWVEEVRVFSLTLPFFPWLRERKQGQPHPPEALLGTMLWVHVVWLRGGTFTCLSPRSILGPGSSINIRGKAFQAVSSPSAWLLCMHPSGGSDLFSLLKPYSLPQTLSVFCCQCQMKQQQRPIEITWYPYHDLPCARACMLTGWALSQSSLPSHQSRSRPTQRNGKASGSTSQTAKLSLGRRWSCQETEVLVISRSKSNQIVNQLIYPETQVRFFSLFPE